MIDLVDSRLQFADAVSETRPDEARSMYEGVIELYSTKPWAEPAVQRARASLRALEKDSENQMPREGHSP